MATPRANGFDQSKAYQQQEEGHHFFDDGREVELLHFVYGHPHIGGIRGSPQKVLQAIDEYARTKKYLMNVGDDKGRIVSELIMEAKPQVMIELGGYVGYSAILFGECVQRAGGQKYLSLERNPEFAAVIMSLVDLAGLSNIVKVVIGSSGDSITRLHAQGLTHIDMIFLDHYKPAYTTDLKLCEHLKLVTPGTVLVADNVIKPGNPPYLEYVRSSVEKKRMAIQSHKLNGDDTTIFEDRWKNQYQNREGEEKLSAAVLGNPNLVYESQLVQSFEPTGVQVCWCHCLRGRYLLTLRRTELRYHAALASSTPRKAPRCSMDSDGGWFPSSYTDNQRSRKSSAELHSRPTGLPLLSRRQKGSDI